MKRGLTTLRDISVLGAGIVAALSFSAEAAAQQLVSAEDLDCNFEEAVISPDGKLRLAMIVGINIYQANTNLHGAVNDASKIYRLLVDENAKTFPKENVCVLTNAEATYEGFKLAFENALVKRARTADGKPADQVVFYYAGHGSRLPDDNGDELDGDDETLFLHDSLARIEPQSAMLVSQLRDDEFNEMLGRLYDRLKDENSDKLPNLVVILDSCHSGTATRSADEIVRFVPSDPSTFASLRPASLSDSRDASQQSPGEGAVEFASFTPLSFPGAVFLSAARDNETAKERDGSGYFTQALYNILSERGGSELTYNQLVARVRAEIGPQVFQTPVIAGDGGRLVFTEDLPYRPRGDWKVATIETAGGVTISGLPTRGIGKGAEFLILPGSMTAEEAADPNIAKARMRAVSAPSSNRWNLELVESFRNDPIELGDYARLVRPSTDARKLRVHVRGPGEAGAINDVAAFEAKIREEMLGAQRFEDGDLIEFTNDNFEFEIFKTANGNLQIADPEGRIRNTYSLQDGVSDVALDLINHLAQLTLLNEWKINGGTMIPNKTLEVWLERYEIEDAEDSNCKPEYNNPSWTPGAPNTAQEIPLCAAYEIWAKLADDAPISLKIGGTVLSADGRMEHIPFEQEAIELARGQKTQLGGFQATPEGLGAQEYIYVLGLPANSVAGEPVMDIPWQLLSTEIPPGRSRNVRLNTRKREFGTYSILPIRVVANPAFGGATGDSFKQAVQTREYTIKKFDVTPYLPDNKSSALRRVLEIAAELTDYKNSGDGVPYKQHHWCEGSTPANLDAGIDCSRAIWYAFTRAGLPYNRYATAIPDEAACVNPYDPTKDGYLYTGDMARLDYLMSDEFESCFAPGENGKRIFELGDVLVYRDAEKGDGHTVMVVDPEQRVAWGSHGWDGNPRFIDEATGVAPEADLGVEFQKIKIKQDWERWDRSSMELVACWRHKTFIEEAKSPENHPGLRAICEAAIRTDTDYYEKSVCNE